MKGNDKAFIKELIASDLKPIGSPNFTMNTIERISETEAPKAANSGVKDLSILYPMAVFALLFISMTLGKALYPWLQPEPGNRLARMMEILSGFLLHPVTISILISISILYLLDVYLKRQHA